MYALFQLASYLIWAIVQYLPKFSANEAQVGKKPAAAVLHINSLSGVSVTVATLHWKDVLTCCVVVWEISLWKIMFSREVP